MSEVDKSVSSSSEDKNNTKRGSYASWTHDANEAGKTSLDTIVDWLIQGENYSKYKGSFKIPGGVNKKTAYCKEIADILMETGHAKRDFKGIMSQISELEHKFKLTMNYLKNQKEQMPNIDIYGDHELTFTDAKGRQKILKEVVNKKFKYFYMLRPVFMKWDIANPEGSSNETPHLITDSPTSSKRQRGEQDEQLYGAPDTVIREDSHGELSSLQVHTLIPSTSSPSSSSSSNPTIAFENEDHGNSSNNNNINSTKDNNHNNHMIYTNHRIIQATPPLQPHSPQHPTLPLQQQQQQQQLPLQEQRKKQKKQQSHDQFTELVRVLLQEQKETIVTNRSSQDEKIELEKEKLLLEKQRLELEERRVALEERKEKRIAFLSALEKLDKEDALYKTSLELYIQKQISENNL